MSTSPSEKKPNDPSFQLSFSFKFFVHGDSTICTSLDVRQHPTVHRLSKTHLTTAQSSQNGVKVILGPYGLSGCLTGQTFKDGDPTVSKVLADWKRFYPLSTSPKDGSQTTGRLESSAEMSVCGRGSMQGQGPVSGGPPALVEVLVAGIKMKYPSCYTFVPLDMTTSDGGINTSGLSPRLHCESEPVTIKASQPDTGGLDATLVLKKVTTPRLSPFNPLCPSIEFNLRLGAIQEIGSNVEQGKEVTNQDNLFWEIVDTSGRLTCPSNRCKSARKGTVGAGKSGNSKIPGKVEKPVRKQPFHKRIGSQSVPDENDPKAGQQLPNGHPKTPVATKSPTMVGGLPSNATTPGCVDSPSGAAGGSEEPGSAMGLSSVSPFPSSVKNESVPSDSVSKSLLPLEQVPSQVEPVTHPDPTPEERLKRPILSDCPEDKLESRRLTSTLLYDMSGVIPSLTAWDINPPKRRRHVPPFSGPDSACADNPSMSKPSIDPYEFSDEELGFIKHETEPSLVVNETIVASKSDLPVASINKESVSILSEQIQTFLVPDQLQPSMNDLDNMFENSSGDDSNDGSNSRSQTRPSVAPPTGQELARMFPTPPSLEPNAIPSPSTTALENSLLESACSPAALESLKVSGTRFSG